MTSPSSARRYSSVTERISGESSRAWDLHKAARERQCEGHEVIVLTIGEHDFPGPEAAVEASVAALKAGRHHYTPSGGDPALREAVARWQSGLSGQALEARNVVILPGAQCALFTAALCLFDPGEEVLVCDPMYATYEPTIRAGGALLRPLPLRPEKDWRLDPADLAASIGPKTRGLVLTSPHNPTGACLTESDLEAIAALAVAHDLWVVSDEVYATMVYEGEHLSPAQFPGMAERTFVLGSLSKSHAMPGWRIGWAAGPAEGIAHMAELSNSMLFGQPPFAMDAATKLLASGDRTPERVRDLYRARRDALCDALEGVEGLSFVRPPAGMFVMLDIRASGLTARDFAFGLLESEGVAVTPAEGFGAMGKGHVRVSISVEADLLAEAGARIARHFQRLRKAA